MMFIQFITVNKTPFMYIDCILSFTTFISRNKHNKNIRLRLYWLRLRVAEAEVQKSHVDSGFPLTVRGGGICLLANFWRETTLNLAKF